MISENRKAMMNTLAEEQFQLIHQYLELVRTVNEAFSYVVTSFEDLSFTEGDRILGDIFMALQQFEGTHIQFVDFFQDQVAVKDSISQFSIILEQVNDLEKVWDSVEARQQLIREKLSPMYASWSNVIFQTLQPMTIS